MPIESSTATPELIPKPTFDSKLEGLRGLAALTVVLGHTIVIKNALDPHYQPTGIFSFQAPGHLSVLVFFILSGYVIGLSTKKPLSKETIGLYLKKRFVRIWPIYIISLILAVLLSPPLPVADIVSSLLFLQILWKPVISANAPLWSLHYEILFYLLFIPVSFFRVRSIYVCIGSFLGGVGFLFFSSWPSAPLLTSYLLGFSLWSLGLVLVDLSRHNAVHYSNSQLVSAFLLFFSLEKTNQLQTVFTKIYQLVPSIRWTYADSIDWPKRAIALVDFSYLPYCILMMIIFTNRSFPLRKLIITLLYAIPAYVLVYLYHNRTNHELVQEYAIPVCSYLMSILLLLLSRAQITEILSSKLLSWSIRLGALSYGLYVIHYPILMLFRRIDYFSGTGITFAVRFFLFIILSIVCADILERKMQPRIRSFFFPK
jgi:peptidoglycan/LPS O-acetylase OafA/YrhL